ncbi:MAG: hypothetical protein C4294_14015, partial [Nitrospiraceae bacterium]
TLHPALAPTASAVDKPADPAKAEPKPFLCRRPVRLTIYAFFALLLIAMVAWRYVPVLLDPTFEKHIAAKRVMVGMSRQQVLQAWGSPYTMNVSYTKDGIRREEWIYEDWESSSIVRHRYLYFEEGILIGGWYYSNSPTPKSASPPRFHDEKELQELKR